MFWGCGCACDCGCRNGFQADPAVDVGGTDDARGGTAGGPDSRISQGLLACFFSIEIPLAPELLIDTGVKALGFGVTDREIFLLPSPSRTRVSTARSTSPPVVLSTSLFLALSLNPISRKYASFWLKLLSTVVILMPNSWLGLLNLFGLGRSWDRSPE